MLRKPEEALLLGKRWKLLRNTFLRQEDSERNVRFDTELQKEQALQSAGEGLGCNAERC